MKIFIFSPRFLSLVGFGAWEWHQGWPELDLRTGDINFDGTPLCLPLRSFKISLFTLTHCCSFKCGYYYYYCRCWCFLIQNQCNQDPFPFNILISVFLALCYCPAWMLLGVCKAYLGLWMHLFLGLGASLPCGLDQLFHLFGMRMWEMCAWTLHIQEYSSSLFVHFKCIKAGSFGWLTKNNPIRRDPLCEVHVRTLSVHGVHLTNQHRFLPLKV